MPWGKPKFVGYDRHGERFREGDKVYADYKGKALPVVVEHIQFPAEHNRPVRCKDRSGYKFLIHSDDLYGRW